MRKQHLKFDISFYIVTILAIMTGYLEQYVIFAITIIIHEAGHLAMARIYRWRLEELKFFGFGGILQFSGELNKSNKEDILISSGGVLFNFIFLIILFAFRQTPMSPIYLKKFQYLMFAQFFVIGFNLLPLPPLDGGRIFSAILCFFFPYKKVLKITVVFNSLVLLTFILITIFFDLRQYMLILSFLIYTTTKHNWQRMYLFQRFLLQKKMNRSSELPIKNVKINDELWEDKIYRGYLNLFQFNTHTNDEIKYLKLKYDEKIAIIVDAKIKS